MTAQWAAFEEDQCPYARPVVKIEILDIEHGSLSRFTANRLFFYRSTSLHHISRKRIRSGVISQVFVGCFDKLQIGHGLRVLQSGNLAELQCDKI